MSIVYDAGFEKDDEGASLLAFPPEIEASGEPQPPLRVAADRLTEPSLLAFPSEETEDLLVPQSIGPLPAEIAAKPPHESRLARRLRPAPPVAIVRYDGRLRYLPPGPFQRVRQGVYLAYLAFAALARLPRRTAEAIRHLTLAAWRELTTAMVSGRERVRAAARRAGVGFHFVIGWCAARYSSARSFERALRQRVFLAVAALARLPRRTAEAIRPRILAAYREVALAIASGRKRGRVTASRVGAGVLVLNGWCAARYSTARSIERAVRQRAYLAIAALARLPRRTAEAIRPRMLAAYREVAIAMAAGRERGRAAAGRAGDGFHFVMGWCVARFSTTSSFERALRQHVFLAIATLARLSRGIAKAIRHLLLAGRHEVAIAIASGRERSGAFIAATRDRGRSSYERGIKPPLRATARWIRNGWQIPRVRGGLRLADDISGAVGLVGVVAVGVTALVLTVPGTRSLVTRDVRSAVTTPPQQRDAPKTPPAMPSEASIPSPTSAPAGASSVAAVRPATDTAIPTRDVRATAPISPASLPLPRRVATPPVQRTAESVGRPVAPADRGANVPPLPAQAQQQTQPAQGYRGSLAVNSSPEGAKVFINGVPVGATPLLLHDLPVGSRVVRIELAGHERWSASVRIVANAEARAVATLRPSSSQ